VQQSRAKRREGAWHALKLVVLIFIWATFLALQLVKDRFHTCSRGYFALYTPPPPCSCIKLYQFL